MWVGEKLPMQRCVNKSIPKYPGSSFPFRSNVTFYVLFFLSLPTRLNGFALIYGCSIWGANTTVEQSQRTRRTFRNFKLFRKRANPSDAILSACLSTWSHVASGCERAHTRLTRRLYDFNLLFCKSFATDETRDEKVHPGEIMFWTWWVFVRPSTD